MVLINHPLVIAHRGSSGSVPENTTLAIYTAFVSQADIVEIDVQLSLDRKVVLFHDRNLNRVTSKTGSISDYTYNDISDLDVGSWQDKKFSELRIPLLSDILSITSGRSLIIEIKPPRHRSSSERYLESNVLEILDDSRGIGSGYISVRDIGTLKWFQDHTNKYRIGLMQKRRTCEELFDLIGDYNIDIIQTRAEQFDEKHYLKLPDFDTETYVYFADTIQDWIFLKDQPINGILTNYPAIMRAYYQNLEGLQLMNS